MATVSHALQTQSQPIAPEILEKVLVGGDLSVLTSTQRLQYVLHVCEAAGVNPATQPLEYIRLNGKLVLYAKKGFTDQLRSRRRINSAVLSRQRQDDVYVVVAKVWSGDTGHSAEDIGAVPVDGLRPDEMANAIMKAGTKAYRRATLALCGFGSIIDESELDTVQVKPVNPDIPEGLQSLYDQCGKSLAAYKAGLDALKCQMTEYCGAEKPFYEILQAHGWSDIEDAGSGKTIGQIRQVMRAVYDAIVRARAGIEGMPPVQEVRS